MEGFKSKLGGRGNSGLGWEGSFCIFSKEHLFNAYGSGSYISRPSCKVIRERDEICHVIGAEDTSRSCGSHWGQVNNGGLHWRRERSTKRLDGAKSGSRRCLPDSHYRREQPHPRGSLVRDMTRSQTGEGQTDNLLSLEDGTEGCRGTSLAARLLGCSQWK